MASVGNIETITLPNGNTYDIHDKNAVVMTGADGTNAGTSGLVPAPTATDNGKFLRGDGTWEDGGRPMVILSYGNSTWNDFITAYNNNVIVYCRASSNSNPATGSQTRMAFMAYVNNSTTPTEVEFQYYRSVSTHSASQQGDQVFVYKLTNASKWTVTTREAMAQIVAGTNLTSTYSNNVLTINGDYQPMTGASSSTAGATGLVPAPSAGDQDKCLMGDGTWATPGDGTLRVVPFSIGVASWVLSEGLYSYTFLTEYITETSVEFIEYSNSYRTAVLGDMNTAKVTGGGGITFTTDVLPVSTLEGEIRIFDRDDGKLAIVTQMTSLSTIRDVPFTISVLNWNLNEDDMYEAVFETPFVTATSHDFVEFDESAENATDSIKVVKASTGMKFITKRIPAGNISGTITPLDNADGKVAIVVQDTVMPISSGGTGANTLALAQQNLGITDLAQKFEYEERADRISIYGGRLRSITYATYRKYFDGRVEIYITGKTASIASDAITLFSISGSNPRLEGHIIYGGTGISNAYISLESGKNYINKNAGAVSDNTDYYVHLSGFEIPSNT